MFINNFDPVAIQIFSFEIRWYSLAYISGILLGWILSKKIFISNPSIKERFDDFITFAIIGIILGGRLGYVLFYNFDYYSNNITDALKIWQGGMSFHGGLIGVIVASIWFSKKNNQNAFNYLDIVSLVAPIGIFFGRIANFINGELYGKPADLPWAVIFPAVDYQGRHPSQIYEALLEGVLLFLILNLIIRKMSYKKGKCAALFLMLYSVFRVLSEFFREPDLQIGYIFNYISMGSLLSFFMFGIGIIMYFKIK